MHTNNGFLRFAKIAAAALMTVVASGIRAQSSYMATEAFVTNHIAQEAARADQRMDEEIAKIATKTVITTNTIPGVVPPVEVITTNIYPIAYSDDVDQSLESARQYTDGAISNIETNIDAKRDYTDLSYNITTATVQKSAWEIYSLNTITGGVSDTAVLVDVQRGESSGRQYENWTGVSVKGTDVSLTIYPNDAYAALNWGGNFGFISDFSGESFKVPAYAGTNTEITVELQSTNSIALQSSVDYVQSYAQGLSNAIKKVAFTGSYNDLTDTPSINGVNLSGDTALSNIGVRAYNDLSFSGLWKVNIFGLVVQPDSAYLIGKETIPTPPQMTRQVKWTGTSILGKYVVLNQNELTNEIDWELNYDPYSSSPAILTTSTAKTPEPTTLQWADKASGEKVEGDSLALSSDATLTPIYSQSPTFTKWTVTPPAGASYSGPFVVDYNQIAPDVWGYDLISDDTTIATVEDPDAHATNLEFTADGVYLATRTRTDIVGYQLGSQTNKVLASEAEAEALRTNKANLSNGKVPTSELPDGTSSAKGIVQLDTALTTSGKAADAKATGDALALKANDNAVVKLTGNQTIAGVKTFQEEVNIDCVGGELVLSNSRDDGRFEFVCSYDSEETGCILEIFMANGLGNNYWITAPQADGILALLQNLAPNYSALTNYAVNQLCVRNRVLKRCTTAGTGNAAVFTNATVEDVLAALRTALADKANDNAVVKLTGDQTVAGAKTFTSGVTVNNASGFSTVDPSNSSMVQFKQSGIEVYPADSSSYVLQYPAVAGILALLSNIGILAFDSTKTYAVGAKVVYDNAVWNCTTAVATAGAWTGATNWTKLFGIAVDSAPTANSDSLMTSAAIKAALDDKADSETVEPLLFAQYYPDGSVKSAAEFRSDIKYDAPDTTNRTITVKSFCNTGDSANDNSSLAGRVVIPPFVDGLGNPYISDDGTRFKVIGVAGLEYASGSQNALTAIVAPNTATTIGDFAFRNCTTLASVSLPVATNIGYNAFNGCTSLASVSLSDATSIGGSALAGCINLASVSLPAATSIDHYAFHVCSALVSVSLPAATNIGTGAFAHCRTLASVDFGATLSSVPTLGTSAFSNVPTTCKIIVPDSLYDAWIAAPGWSTLYNDGNGYKFLKHSEWEYARKYEIVEASELSVRNEFRSWSLTPDSKGDDAITIMWDSTDNGWVLYFQGAKSSSALGSFYGSEHLVWTNEALQISGVSSVVADRERLPGYILGDQTNKVLAAQSEFDALSTNLATKADTTLAELTEFSDWTILRNGDDVTGQVGQPSYDSGWTVYNSVISGDYGVSEAEGDANATNLSWTANDGSVQYIATRVQLHGYILGTQTNKVLAAQSAVDVLSTNSATKSDATLNLRGPNKDGFGAWTIKRAGIDVTEQVRQPEYLEISTGVYGWRVYSIAGDEGQGQVLASDDAVSLEWSTSGGMYIAARTALQGLILGTQTNKVLATEGEAEELRARVSGVAISATNYTDMAVSNAFVMLTVIDDLLVPSEGVGSSSVYYTDAQSASYLDRHFPDWTTSSSNQIAIFRNYSSPESSVWRYNKELFVDQIVFALKGSQSSSSHFRRSVTFPVQGVYRVTVEYAPIMQQTTLFSVDIGVKCSGGDAVWQSLGTQDYSKRNSTSMLVSASKGAGHIEIMSKEAANTGFVFSRLKVELVSKIGVEVAEIDDHLDANSTNPVQNKVISETIDGLATTSMVNVAVSVAMKSYQTLSSPNPVHGTGGTNTYTMANNSCNYVTQGASAPYPTAIVFNFPTVEGDEARNFSVYYACSDYTKSGIILPDVAILVVDGDSSSIACENGINLFTFKEVRRNEFVVTRQTVAPVGQ